MLGDWLWRMARRPRGRTIELIAGDRMALGRTICGLGKAERAALPWPEADTQRLYQRLMARNPRGYDGWHPGGVQRIPVTLRRVQWRMVEHLCARQMTAVSEEWPARVLAAITARAGRPW